MRDAAYRSSIALAKEKGAFPLFDAQQMLAPGTFASRLPAHIKDAICQHGLRNSHLLSIALLIRQALMEYRAMALQKSRQ